VFVHGAASSQFLHKENPSVLHGLITNICLSFSLQQFWTLNYSTIPIQCTHYILHCGASFLAILCSYSLLTLKFHLFCNHKSCIPPSIQSGECMTIFFCLLFEG
jgi:hypothetical protein